MSYLASRIRIIEEPPKLRPVPALPSAVAAFIGFAERGPVNDPQEITSWEQYTRLFGEYFNSSVHGLVQMPLAVRAYFLNGGKQAVIVRVLEGTPATATVTIQDRAATPVDTLRVDATSPGEWGNNLSVEIRNATSGASDEFDMVVYKSGVIVETWNNLSMTDSDDNFVEKVINGNSLYITVTDLDSTSGTPTDLPALGTYNLAGGTEGAAATDSTFTGAFTPLKSVAHTLISAPDRQTTTFQQSLIQYCELDQQRRVFAVLEAPSGSDAAAVRSHIATIGASEVYALYWPWIRILNPDTTVFGSAPAVLVPPSGAVMGVMARVDATSERGPFENPAGVEFGKLQGVVELERTDVLRQDIRDLVYPDRVNPITWLRSWGFFIDGSRTGQASGNFPSVGERRGISFIEATIKDGLQWVRHRPNTRELRAMVEGWLRGLLNRWMERGAFASRKPEEAYYVDVSDDLNTPDVVAQGKLLVRIGVATARPAEFIDIFISQDTSILGG